MSGVVIRTAVAMSGVVIRTADLADPRLTRAQVLALEAAVKADPDARVLGLDEKMRPVVKARLGIPPMPRTYAVLRNGDATDFRILDEVWHTAPPR